MPVLLLAACGDQVVPETPLGAFVLDRAAMQEALVAQGIPAADAERHAQAARVELAFRDDGTFTLRRTLGDGEREARDGIWVRVDDQVAITTLRVDGEDLERPTTVAAVLEDGRLRLAPEHDLDPGMLLVSR